MFWWIMYSLLLLLINEVNNIGNYNFVRKTSTPSGAISCWQYSDIRWINETFIIQISTLLLQNIIATHNLFIGNTHIALYTIPLLYTFYNLPKILTYRNIRFCHQNQIRRPSSCMTSFVYHIQYIYYIIHISIEQSLSSSTIISTQQTHYDLYGYCRQWNSKYR